MRKKSPSDGQWSSEQMGGKGTTLWVFRARMQAITKTQKVGNHTGNRGRYAKYTRQFQTEPNIIIEV